MAVARLGCYGGLDSLCAPHAVKLLYTPPRLQHSRINCCVLLRQFVFVLLWDCLRKEQEYGDKNNSLGHIQ